MTAVTIALPDHDESVTGRIRWADTSGLGDISTIEATPGTAVLRRFQIRADGQDTSNHVQVQSNGPELSTDWETSAVGVTVQVAGLDDLVIVGPDNSLNASQDSSEPYQWVPGDDYDNGAITYLYSGNDAPAGLAAWLEDFKAAYAADTTLRATLILDDGVSSGDHAIDGGDISWTFELPVPTATHVLAGGTTEHEVSGGDINWLFNLPRPTATHTQVVLPVVPIAPRINDQPFRDALISQWRSGSIAPQLIDVMLTATDRLYIANVNLLLKGLDIDVLYGVLLDYAGYRFGIRRPLVDTTTAQAYFGFDGTGNTPATGSFDEAPFFSQNAFSDSKAPLADRFFRSLVKLAAFNKIGVKTNEKCLGALKTVYPDGYIQDNLDLSITYFVDDSAMMLSVLIGEMNLWPKPAGIAYDVMAIP